MRVSWYKVEKSVNGYVVKSLKTVRLPCTHVVFQTRLRKSFIFQIMFV